MTIIVLTEPQTIFQKIRYWLTGQVPAMSCDQVANGPGILECIWLESDSCRALRLDHVLEVIWDGGYSKEVARVKAEHFKNLGITSPDEEEEDDDCGDKGQAPIQFNPPSADVNSSYR